MIDLSVLAGLHAVQAGTARLPQIDSPALRAIRNACSIAAAHPALMDRAAFDARTSFHLHRDIMARIPIYAGMTKPAARAVSDERTSDE